MKKLFLALLAAMLLLCACCAASAVEYTVTSVTDCAQTESRYDRFYQSGETPFMCDFIFRRSAAFILESSSISAHEKSYPSSNATPKAARNNWLMPS